MASLLRQKMVARLVMMMKRTAGMTTMMTTEVLELRTESLAGRAMWHSARPTVLVTPHLMLVSCRRNLELEGNVITE